eukprot:749312-Hanusia_phi.AAC.1
MSSYDYETNSWRPETSLPSPRSSTSINNEELRNCRWGGAMASHDGMLYYMGGSDGSDVHANMWSWNSRWCSESFFYLSMPLACSYLNLPPVASSPFLLLSSHLNCSQRQDMARGAADAAEKVEEERSLRTFIARRCEMTAVPLGDGILVIGGHEDSTVGRDDPVGEQDHEPSPRSVHNSVEYFDLKTRKWRLERSLREERYAHGAAVLGNRVFVVGGSNSLGKWQVRRGGSGEFADIASSCIE